MTLEVENLSFSLSDTKILSSVSFTAKSGEFIGLIGPNGAGKTTLIKCISGILKGSGSVTLDDIPLRRLPVKQVAQSLAVMYQNTTVSYPFPSLDIVLMGRYPHQKHGDKPEDYSIARECMEFTDTLRFEKKLITSISGGERQRVLFAKVMAQQTDILLLDEPTASLDISHQEHIFRYAKELCGMGKLVIAAVHDLKVAARYCSRLLMMKDGEILADGSVDDVLTSELISRAYEVNAVVYRNDIGLLDFYIAERAKENRERHVHVIAGGGCASGVMRYLFGKGYEVTTGVVMSGDSDLRCAEAFNLKAVVAPAFTVWSEDTCTENILLIKNAAVTVLCCMPFGLMNIENLRMSLLANRLVIIEDEPINSRDYTDGLAEELYNRLISEKNATVIPSARLHEVF